MSASSPGRLTLLGLVGLFSLRFVGFYNHQALAVVSRVWLVRKGCLHPLRGFRGRESRPQLLQAVGRASFWLAASAACLAVFPRSAELTPLIVTLAGICVARIAASFLTSHRTNTGPTLVMVAGAFVLAFDLGRALIGGSAAIAQIAPPFEGEWLVQPLLSPADGKVVVARDEMEDADGANFVTDAADAAGNVIVIELDTGLFVVLAHLRHGTLRVSEGDRVRKGDPLALVGNSGNTTMPHLHLPSAGADPSRPLESRQPHGTFCIRTRWPRPGP